MRTVRKVTSFQKKIGEARSISFPLRRKKRREELKSLTFKDTPRPNVTSPDTVRWSSSIRSGIVANLLRNSFTLAKWLSPSFTRGVEGNIRCGDMTREPWDRLYRLDMTRSRSEVFLTGKNRLRGTFTPIPPSKHFMAAPTAVSSCITFRPSPAIINNNNMYL